MDTLPQAARALETRIRKQIPLTRAIDLSIRAWNDDTLVMAAPLEPNVNDKGCAFGGSLASLMTVAGWALVLLALDRRTTACDIFVAHSEVSYLTPVWHDFEAHTALHADANWDTFFAALAQRGKARIRLSCDIRETGRQSPCATLDADFVAKRRDAGRAPRALDGAQ